MKMPSKLKIDKVSYSYDGENNVVCNACFEWDKGILCIKGPSGSGKTTLLKIVAGLIAPDEGQIFIDGKDLKKIKIKNRKMAFIFQENCLYPHMTIYKNMLVACKDEGKVRYWLKKTGMIKYVNFLPSHLSQGMRQKVALAKLLASDSDIWILDEAFANLDENFKQEIIPVFKSEAENRCVLYVGHDDTIFSEHALWVENGTCKMGQNFISGTSFSAWMNSLQINDGNKK